MADGYIVKGTYYRIVFFYRHELFLTHMILLHFDAVIFVLRLISYDIKTFFTVKRLLALVIGHTKR